MQPRNILLCTIFLTLRLVAALADASGSSASGGEGEGGRGAQQAPLVMVGILARNTAHTLPNFLGYLENMDYPKHRMKIWIRTDHNEDETLSMLSEWTEKARPLYSSVDLGHEEKWLYTNTHSLQKSDETYIRMSQLRQEGLDEARKSRAHYLLWLDCDTFIINNQTLWLLIEQQKDVIAPMLEAGDNQAYSNYWCGQNAQGYYARTPDYLPILKRSKVGSFKVPVLYSALLIDLQNPKSGGLSYWPLSEGFTGPVDDIIHFAYSARVGDMGMYILNTEQFGYIIKSQEFTDMPHAVRHFLNFKMKTLVNHLPVPSSQYLSISAPKTKVGLDEIFMISLARRPERRNRMLACLDALSLNITLFEAVDGKKMNQSYLDELGITYMPGWKDPWGERPMTFGEVGCFLSHYFIWQKMLDQGLEEVLVLEDDIDFEPDFREGLQVLLGEAHTHTPTWDLIYVGRKILNWEDEELVSGTSVLVTPHYSYWTLGYLISLRGARKLMEAQPFNKLLPVDEYLPIMFNTHPEQDWVNHFPTRNLEVYSASPLLVNPTHYVGDEGWFSDTEPPLEVLERIRQRKVREEKEEEEKKKEEEAHQKEVKEQATKRQIEAMRAKLKPKTEL